MPVILAFESAKWLDSDLKEGAVYIVKGEKTNERAQGSSRGRDGPIVDEIELRFGRAVTIRGDVMTDIFDSQGEEFAFLQLERHSVFHEDVTNTFK